MPIPAPELDELRAVSQRWGLGIGDGDLAIFQLLIEGALGSYQHVDAMYDASKPSMPERSSYRPDDADNELGAWYYRCDIQESDSGPLVGKTFAIKDNATVAGIPMMNGSRIVEGYVPWRDATVVTRILEAGGRILGKSSAAGTDPVASLPSARTSARQRPTTLTACARSAGLQATS